MIVVADTGPILYLFLIGEAEILQALYGEVAIPSAVAIELKKPATPGDLRNWIAKGVPWLSVHSPEVALLNDRNLDDGEREAIALASQLKADYLLIDDEAGRRAARLHTTSTVTGTIGVIYAAALLQTQPAKSASVYFENCIEKLRQTNFYFSENLNRTIEQLKNRLGTEKEL